MNPVPVRPANPEWKFKGSDGRFCVWHVGKNDYRVSDGPEGEVLGQREHYGSAFSLASYYQIQSKYGA